MAALVTLEGPDRVAAFADALARGEIHTSITSGALQASLNIAQARLRPYRDVLLTASDITDLVLALRVSAATAFRAKAAQPLIEVAWTYPGEARPGLRTTGGVAREIIDGAMTSLLVVGYTVTVDPSLCGLAAQTVAAIARAAAERSVVVTAVLHRNVNRRALLQSWHVGVPAPAIFTWPLSGDEKAAVHAKLLVSDRKDGLITSANLTYHGFERNLEMGLRATGSAAAEIHDRIHELIAAHDLVPWDN